MGGEIKKNDFLILIKTYEMIRATDVFKGMTDPELVKYIIYCASRKWLRFEFEGDELVFVGCGYRIKEFKHEESDKVPQNDEGKILYVPFIVCTSKDKLLPKKILTQYLADNPEVDEIIFYEIADSSKPLRFKRKGDLSGQERREATVTANADISA